jgi:hypothetical protein
MKHMYYYCLNFSHIIDSYLPKVWGNGCNMFAMCVHVGPFWVFWFISLRDIHKINDRLNEYYGYNETDYIINDGSPVISRNTWSMYAR